MSGFLEILSLSPNVQCSIWEKRKIVQLVLRGHCKEETLIFEMMMDLATKKIFLTFLHMLNLAQRIRKSVATNRKRKQQSSLAKVVHCCKLQVCCVFVACYNQDLLPQDTHQRHQRGVERAW